MQFYLTPNRSSESVKRVWIFPPMALGINMKVFMILCSLTLLQLKVLNKLKQSRPRDHRGLASW